MRACDPKEKAARDQLVLVGAVEEALEKALAARCVSEGKRKPADTQSTQGERRRGEGGTDGKKLRGMGRLFQRGNVWWIAYYRRGKEIRESARTTDDDKAKKLLKHRLKEVHAEEMGGYPFIGPAQRRLTVAELLDALEQHYKLQEGRALAQFQSHVKPGREYFGDWRAVNVTSEAVDRYILARQDAGKAHATVNRETQLLGQAFRLAIERKRLALMPKICRLPERNVRRGFFERAEFEAVIANLPECLKDFTRFACLTGWRRGEIASLGWLDVDRAGKAIRLRPEHSKNGEPRLVPLEGELENIVERQWVAREYKTPDGPALSAFVFHRKGDPIRDIRKAWASACEAAGLPGKLFHDLRRTAVRNMVRAGVREGIAMAISGHRTRSMFDRYNIVDLRDLREAVRKTQAHVESQPVKQTVVVLPVPVPARRSGR